MNLCEGYFIHGGGNNEDHDPIKRNLEPKSKCVQLTLFTWPNARLPVHENANQPNKHPLSSSKVQVDLISVEKTIRNTLASKVWKQNHLPNLHIYRLHGNQVSAHPMAKNATSCAANSVDQRWSLRGPIGWDICKFKNKQNICMLYLGGEQQRKTCTI